MDIKFKYYYELFGTICSPVLTLAQIENGLACTRSFPSSAIILGKSQFTGLQDIEGADIYVGDILHCLDPICYEPLTVIYDEDNCNYMVDHGCGNWFINKHNVKSYEWIIIGNIYQNANLLKGES